MRSYATRLKAERELISRGFELTRSNIMGAANWRKGAAYAWIEHEWSPKHQTMRYFIQARG